MSINLKTCPNCGVAAIRVEKDTKPNEVVECNNCHYIYTLKKLKENLKKK
jgi:uncharacterized Zn finger protein